MITRNVNKIKQLWKPGTLLAPVPAVMVTCKGSDKNSENIITIGWTGIVCSTPPMLSISVRPERYSHKLISESGEFCVNIPTKELAAQTDLCGVKSGKNCNKFHETGLTKANASEIDTPIILECPVNIECRVKQSLELGSHTIFLAEIVAVQVDKKLISKENKLELEKAKLLCYAHGYYYQLGKQIGSFGFSVKKR